LLLDRKLACSLAAAVASAAALLAAPAGAWAASAPASDVRVGEVLAQLQRSGNTCTGTLTQPVQVTVQATQAEPGAYVVVAVNGTCQFVVSKIAYGTFGAAPGGTASATGSSATAPASQPPGVISPASHICARWTDAEIQEQGETVYGYRTYDWLMSQEEFHQNCDDGSNVYIVNAGPLAASANVSLVGGQYGYSISINKGYPKFSWQLTTKNPKDYDSPRVDSQASVQDDPLFGRNAWGDVEAVDTSYPDGAITGNCYVGGGNLAVITGDHFACSVGR
jgi:hypothetical protein